MTEGGRGSVTVQPRGIEDAEIERAPRPIRYPRVPANALEGGYWARAPDGKFALRAPWREDVPVIGVSWQDAVAYARWRTRGDHERGEDWVYELPTVQMMFPATGYGAEAGFRACDRAVQTFGGMGYAKECNVERYWRESRLHRIAPISNEMVLNFISEHVLGLPRSY